MIYWEKDGVKDMIERCEDCDTLDLSESSYMRAREEFVFKRLYTHHNTFGYLSSLGIPNFTLGGFEI